MNWQHVRVAVLAGSFVVATGLTARADDCCTPAPACRTVWVNEWVPEKYESTVTVYKKVESQEKYTAWKCESVPETKTREVTYYERVPETKEVVHHVCVSVPHQEEVTCMEKHWVCVPETKVVRKCVDKGHYECKEVPCGPGIRERLHGWFHKDCCDSCNTCADSCCPPKTKTVRCWVPCPTWEEHTVTCMKKVCECTPVKKMVTVCKTEMKEVKSTVTCYKCVAKTKTETYTCCVTKKVPVECTRTVVKCVPTTEKVTCTRMVCKKVEKTVPVSTCCETTCCKPSWFHKAHSWFHKESCCD